MIKENPQAQELMCLVPTVHRSCPTQTIKPNQHQASVLTITFAKEILISVLYSWVLLRSFHSLRTALCLWIAIGVTDLGKTWLQQCKRRVFK